MKKISIFLFLLLISCSNKNYKSFSYYEATVAHILQLVVSGDCKSKCVSSIVNNDLKYMTYTEATYILNEVSKKLPKIFKGVKREISTKIEDKYKKEK